MSSKNPVGAQPAAAREEHSSFANHEPAESKAPFSAPTSGILPRGGLEPPGMPIEPTPRQGLLPVSFAQQRLWFVAQMFPQAPTYNEPIMVQMPGPVDVLVLAQSLTEITRRHEAWRTVFTTVDGVPMQQIRPLHPFELPTVDLTSLPADEREAATQRVAVSDARRPFDLRQGPLVRALLIRLSPTDMRLIVTAHHIVVDGVSFFQIFLPELHALYVAFSNGRPSPLADLPIQYADFAAWQRAWLTEEELAPKLSYWRTHMAGLTELAVPTDHPRPNDPTWDGARIPLALPSDLTAKLRDLGHRAGVTLFTTLLAAWKTLLFRYCGQGDIVVGSASAGRPRRELDPLIGFFNSNLVLRTQLDGSLTFLELLPRVGDVLKAAREHEDVPFDRLITELSVNRSLNKNPIYQNVFLLMPRLPPLDGLPRWNVSRFDIGTAKVDVYLELHQRPQGLVGHIEYLTELFSAATIERMIGHFQTLLEGIVANPEQRISELPILTASEQQQLAVWQGPAVAPLPDSEVLSLEQLFEAQVARSPSAIAVEHGDQRLTYAELNVRANQLAHYLRCEGVGPDTLVGLCVKRSFDAMVGILGVLKAGGAYVPLDPDYPGERLRFILEDADIKLLLTNRENASSVQSDRRMVRLDEDWPHITRHNADNPAPVARAENLAYVIYTSGSTGRPKGVLVERRGLYHLAKAQERMFGLGVGSRVLQFFSLNFDVSLWEFTMTFPVGATLILADQAAVLAGANLARLLKEKDIHVLAATPSALMVTPHHELTTLHTVIVAGEAVPEELVRQWAPGRRFFNGYGPTETTVVSVIAECHAGQGKPPIGRPFGFVPVYILDNAMQRVPIGVVGELYSGGPGVARGYLNDPRLTAARFVVSPFAETAWTRLYKTGDRVKWRPDGTIDYLGRIDRQIKLRGFRIELGEVEAVLDRHPAVLVAAVKLLDVAGDKRLIAYVVPRPDAPKELESELKKHLRDYVPEHMVPASFVTLHRMPVNSSGKIDRAQLPAPSAPGPSVTPPSMFLEQTVAAVWQEILGVNAVDADVPFFEVGGHSLALARVQAKLSAKLGMDVDIMTLMRLPTIRKLATHLATLPGIAQGPTLSDQTERPDARGRFPEHAQPVAIVGMAIRAPGVRTPEELWEVARTGRETIRVLNPEALIAAGADPGRVRRPGFIPAEGVLDDADRFDAAFFGYSDADATLMDPQQRLFLECAYEALQHAACDPSRFQGKIGVFGGVGAPLYWLGPVAQALRSSGSDHDSLRAHTLNAPDFLASRVAFKLGLRGPAVTVQAACSTSLAAVHLARQSLLAGDCDMALAGGVTLATLSDADRGYLHADGGGHSSDGHCRPFDAGATGMVKSSGVALVALKRLSDALAAGDTIYAVVLGSAMNNDGAGKMGFTAPSEDGVADAIQRAYEVAGIDPGAVQFVEAHGTGTRIGDPIEVRALTRAFRHWTEERGFCALGSLKANLGHLDTAAGAAGLIKAVLALSREAIPPVAGFRAPNPLLDLPSTPFFVNDVPLPWPRTQSPRRASVNAMGVGGTNVHVVLEEGPVMEAAGTTRPFQLLCLSARTETALAEVTRRLSAHLAKHPSLDIADTAHTLALGRTQLGYRTTIVCRDAGEAQHALTHRLAASPSRAKQDRPVVFLFSGYGGQYLRMGLEIYDVEPTYRAEIDRCFDILREDASIDLRRLWVGQMPEAELRLEEAQWVQPLLFTIEYALAKQFMTWGVRPAALLGHSLGEYVAACIAGVLSLRDALALVIARSRLADTTPAGAMLAAFTDPKAIEPYLGAGVAIATVAPGTVVLSGLTGDIEAVCRRLANAGIATKVLRAFRAGHSPVMHTIRDAFRRRVAEVALRSPTIPIVSNFTGAYLTAEQATSPDYWADHLCNTVRLTDGLGTLLALDSPICIELGPGTTLGSFLKGHPQYECAKADVVWTLPDFRNRHEPSSATLLRGLGRMWELGVEVNWKAFYVGEKRRRIPLPTYPFEGRRYVLGEALVEDPAALDTRASGVARELGVRGVDDYPGLRTRLEELCASLVLDFFVRRLGDKVGRAYPVELLQRETGVLPMFSRMFDLLLRILVSGELAAQTSTGETLLRAEHAGRSTELAARLRQDYPAVAGLFRILEHCASHYDEALTGIVEPIGVVYPDGTDAFYRECMRDTVPYTYHLVYAALAREAVIQIIGRHKGRQTRILEVGAGHGMLTWPLVNHLRGADVEYDFTDIGRAFLLRAEGEIERRGITWMKSFRFDLNKGPEEQGILGPYDIILGLNSVHVALDLPATLGNLHNLLVPGGSLILVEVTRIETWDHLIGGLMPGYCDIAHARGALSMSLARWKDYLQRAHFTVVTSAPADANRHEMDDHGLLIAKRTLIAGPRERMEMKQPAASGVAQITSLLTDGDKHHSAPGSAPDDVEQLVHKLWRRLLGVSHVPAGVSFFELGGDSLLAVQLLSEVRTKMGCEMKMRQFTTQPTVDGMVALLRSHRGPVTSATPMPPKVTVPMEGPRVERPDTPSSAADCLVPLQSAGTKRPFFCVHPIGGGALCYVPLARTLDPDRPFFGIQSTMLGDRSTRPGSVTEIAAHYVDAIRRVQSMGPYFLGGWSFGGVIAAEMVRQLQSCGQDVAQLVLLDVSASPAQSMEVLRRIDERLPVLAMLPGIFAEPMERGRPGGDRVSRLADNLTVAAQNLVLYNHHLALWRRHTPTELDVPAIHFVADERPMLRSLLRAGGSRRLAIRAMSMVRVPGNHFSMISGDNVKGLAAQIRVVLDAAELRERSHSAADDGSLPDRDEASVRTFLQQFVDLMERRDAASLAAIYATDCVNVLADESILVGSDKMKQHYLREMTRLRHLRFYAHNWHVLVVAGGRVAYAIGQLDSDKTLHDGRRVSFRGMRTTLVLENQGHTWRVVHSHCSLPAEGPVDMMEVR